MEHTVDDARLHVLQDLALTAELARRIKRDLQPALALALHDLRQVTPADHERMLRVEHACDLQSLGLLRRG
jgi:hypothetical protein